MLMMTSTSFDANPCAFDGQKGAATCGRKHGQLNRTRLAAVRCRREGVIDDYARHMRRLGCSAGGGT